MNKTESLDILNKYIDALKEKAETEERLGKIGTENKNFVREAAFEEFPFSKLIVPFLLMFEIPGVIICMFIKSDLSYKAQIPVIAAIIGGCAASAFIGAKIAHVLINRSREKQNKDLVTAVNILGIGEAADLQEIINKDIRKIAEAESAIPLACHSSMAAKQARKLIMSGKAENLVEAAGAYTQEDWDWAYKANPKFFGSDSEEGTFGAIALSEATRTVLPKDPQKLFPYEGRTVSNWKTAYISLTKDEIIGDCDYYRTLSMIERYIIDSKDDYVLVRGLTLKELERLIKSGKKE